jgi:hypothetical protein
MYNEYCKVPKDTVSVRKMSLCVWDQGLTLTLTGIFSERISRPNEHPVKLAVSQVNYKNILWFWFQYFKKKH